MIVEHPDVSAAEVAAAAAGSWGLEVGSAEHLTLGSRRWHWLLRDDAGPHWLAGVDHVRDHEERHSRLASYDVAARLSQRLSFVVAPVPTRDGRIAVDLAPGLLLTLTPYLEGKAVGTGRYHDDRERAVVANMLGDLHRQRPARPLPRWRPRIGRHGRDLREELARCLDPGSGGWSGGPWSGPAGRLVADSAPVLRAAVRRFTLLGGAVSGTAEPWVVSHGQPDSARLVRTPDGHRLVDWERLALAPRERDLCEVLGGAEGDEPWYAYLESGGLPKPLATDAVELFVLQRHLTAVAEACVRLSATHGDGADERRCFGELEHELGALLDHWA